MLIMEVIFFSPLFRDSCSKSESTIFSSKIIKPVQCFISVTMSVANFFSARVVLFEPPKWSLIIRFYRNILRFSNHPSNLKDHSSLKFWIKLTLIILSSNCFRYKWFRHALSKPTTSWIDKYCMIWCLKMSSGSSSKYSISLMMTMKMIIIILTYSWILQYHSESCRDFSV